MDWVLNTPLILSSYVIWKAYRSIEETKVFRLDISLICLLYVKGCCNKIILQKGKTYYFKYQRSSGIFTITNHIFDNSIQINIKFTFTAYGYTIVYEVFEYVSFLFIVTLSQHIHAMVTLVSHSHIIFQLVLFYHCH